MLGQSEIIGEITGSIQRKSGMETDDLLNGFSTVGLHFHVI